MRRFSLRSLHCGTFTAEPSLRSLHCGTFTAEPSLRSLHCGTFTANSHCGSPARKLSFSASIDPPTATPEGPTLVKALTRTNVTLSCGFTGLPVPNITWTRNGDPNIRGVATTITTGNRSKLTVQEVTHEQDRDGVYRCTANNTIGRVSLVDFTVQGKPHLSPTACACNHGHYTVLPEPVTAMTSSPSDTFVSIRWTYQSSGSSPRTMEGWG